MRVSLPVWVIPAKGAALSDTIHSITPIRSKPRVAIIGAGVIGLGIAWRLAPRAAVTVFDRGKAGSGASHAAAGMLAACAEAEPGEETLVALGRESQRRWPAFAEELERTTGVDVELRTEGTLVVALTADDQATIEHHLEFQLQLALPLEWLSAAATRAREPRLAGKIAGALFSPEDHQVDNRKLVQALRVAVEAAGVRLYEHRPFAARWSGEGRRARRRNEHARRHRGVGRRRMVARHQRASARSAAAGAPGQGADAGAEDGSGGAASQSRAVGAWGLSGAAARWPFDHRRHGRGKGLRPDDHRRRNADVVGSRVARRACGRGIAGR